MQRWRTRITGWALEECFTNVEPTWVKNSSLNSSCAIPGVLSTVGHDDRHSINQSAALMLQQKQNFRRGLKRLKMSHWCTQVIFFPFRKYFIIMSVISPHSRRSCSRKLRAEGDSWCRSLNVNLLKLRITNQAASQSDAQSTALFWETHTETCRSGEPVCDVCDFRCRQVERTRVTWFTQRTDSRRTGEAAATWFWSPTSWYQSDSLKTSWSLMTLFVLMMSDSRKRPCFFLTSL